MNTIRIYVGYIESFELYPLHQLVGVNRRSIGSQTINVSGRVVLNLKQ